MVSRNAESGPRETAQDIVDYLKFAGFELTRDQLLRLHQRRLIDRPFHGPTGGRGLRTIYPAGTAERMLRIAQLKTTSKQLDELAWRLWWEGSSVEPDLIRDYLVKMANRWDDRLGEIRQTAAASVTEEGAEGERDILDEVFFQHLKLVPSMASVRKRLGKGSDIYLEFAGLLIDLFRGNFSVLGEREVSLFDAANGDTSDNTSNSDGSQATARSALDVMQEAVALPYVQVVESLSDEQIAAARPVALLFSRIIASIGEIMHDGDAGAGRGHDTVGKNLVALSESPEEQVLSLLLTSSFLKDDRIRESIPEFETLVIHAPAISYLDYLRIRFLAREVPGMGQLVAPSRIREAFESFEGAEQWRASFEVFRLDHLKEFEVAMASRPELFGEQPPSIEEPMTDGDDEDSTKKKKIKTGLKRPKS